MAGGVGRLGRKACMADQVMQMGGAYRLGVNRTGLLGLVVSCEIGPWARPVGHLGLGVWTFGYSSLAQKNENTLNK